MEDWRGEPTWSKTCHCGATVERWRGESEVTCSFCNQEYNAFGQELISNWRGNASNYDEDVSDLDGYEVSQLREEMY